MPREKVSQKGRLVLRRCVVGVIAITLVVAAVAWTQKANSDNEFVALESDDSGLERAEKVGIIEAQRNLQHLEAKVKEESDVFSKHHRKEKRENILSLASRSKAAAAKKTAKALLETVKEHTEQIAKIKFLKESALKRAIYKKEHAKVLSLRKKAAKTKARENFEIKRAQKETHDVEMEQKEMKELRDEKDKDELAESNMKLLVKNELAQAKAKEHIANLGIESAKSRRRQVEHLENKERRLRVSIRHMHNRQRRDKESQLADQIAAKDYRRQGEDQEATKERLRDQIHKDKMAVDRQNRKADELSSKLETAKENLHDKDDALQRAKSTEHEANTMLQRAKHILRQAERNIYHQDMRNEADRHPSDVDLGLV